MRWSGRHHRLTLPHRGGSIYPQISQPAMCEGGQMCLFSGHSPALIASRVSNVLEAVPGLPVPSLWCPQGWQLWVVSSDPSDARQSSVCSAPSVSWSPAGDINICWIS